MNSSLLDFVCIFCFALASYPANAALISRLDGQAVYDTDMAITWLADANAGAGSVFDDASYQESTTTDGRMTLPNAIAWADSLNVGGVTGWRLPTALVPDTSCSGSHPLIVSSGYCSGSEMGHLFYQELGGTEGQSILTSGDPDLALFSNIQAAPQDGGFSFAYWTTTDRVSTTPNTSDLVNVYIFNFYLGHQGSDGKSDTHFAWAVHDGDPFAPVPLPPAFYLFGSGLIGLVGMARRKRLNNFA